MSIRIGNNIITSSTITSGDVTSALGYTPADQASLATVATSGDFTDLTNTPTVDQTYDGTSTNAQSGTAVASAISTAISTTYKAAGSIAFANLPTLSAAIEGNVYNITDSFTTTSDFVEGAGNTYGAGTNIVCINIAASGQTAVYKWDVLGGFVDQLPSQTGQSGKFLTTNGSTTSWGNALANETHYSGSSASIALTENTLASNKDSVGGVIIGYNAQGTSGQGYEIVIGNGAKASWMGNVTIGYSADGAGYDGSVTIGDSAKTGKKTGGSSLSYGTAVGGNANAKGNKSVALGYNAKIDGDGSIQIGEGNHTGDNVFYITSYKLMDLSDGTIPEARLADTTSATTGQALVLDSTGNAVWATVDGLPSQSGQSGKYLTTNGTTASWATVDSLPSQSGQSGKFLTTDGTAASWATVDALPSQTGNANKFLTTNGTSASWSNPVVATLKVWGANE